MSDATSGPLATSAPSHTATQQWQSFELRMRRRRAERCRLRAAAALDAGYFEDAQDALAEARILEPDSAEIGVLERRLNQALAPPPVALHTTSHHPRRWAIFGVLVLAISAAAVWTVLSQRSSHRFAPPAAQVQAAESYAAAPAARAQTAAVDMHAEPTAGQVEPAGDPRAIDLLLVTSTRPEEPASSTEVETFRVPALETAALAIPPDSHPAPTAPVVLEPPAPGPLALPEPAESAPTPPPSLAAMADDDGSVRSVLARYEAAYTELNANAVREIWPGMDEKALARAFRTLTSQRLLLDRCDIHVTGATARAECTGTATWTPKVGGGRRTQLRSWTFDLKKQSDNWTIESARVR